MGISGGGRAVFSPAQKFVLAAMLGVLVHALVIWAMVVQPWIGIGVAANPDGAGWVVTGVPEDSHAFGKMDVGDVILSVVGQDGSVVEARPDLLIQDLFDVTTIPQWLAFLKSSEQLNNFMQQSRVTVVLADGERVTWDIPPIGFAQLNFYNWFGFLMSFAVWLMVSFIWIFSERSQASYFLLLLGVGFFCIVCGQSVSVITFAAITSNWVVLNYFGCGLFSGALLSLLMVYPSRLANNYSYLPVVALTPLMLLLPHLAINPNIFMNIFSLALMLSLGMLVILQWRHSSEHPVQRAMFRWFFGVVLLSVLLTIILMIEGATIVIGMMPIGLMFLGFVFGVRRYRLFDVERWWFALWVWLIGGMAVMALDGLLVWDMGLGQSVSLTLALVLVGWVYFPLRQKLWGRWVGGAGQTVEHYLPELIASIFGEDTQQPLPQRWQAMMRRIFQPLALEVTEVGVERAQLAADGTALLLPGVAGEPGLRLGYAQQGKRLFSRQDAQLAQSLVELGRRAVQLHVAREQGAEAERQRIVRDLHDDVGAELVTLMHRLQHTEHAARVAQVSRNLRGVVSGLSHHAVPLYEAAGEWRAEAGERCRLAGVELIWLLDEGMEHTMLTPRQFINLSRILREAVTNVLRHARSASLEVAFGVRDGRLELTVGDSGIGFDGKQPQGNGGRNMRLRAEELGGSIAWHAAVGAGCRMTLKMPLLAKQ
ncbi:MAG: hypothetical protein PHQ60_06220 [Sideroxydans sp.]|nr:hypothetical protein [Sideroxydans sp.]